MATVYGHVTEEMPRDVRSFRNPVVTATYEDANVYLGLLRGRSLTGSLHLVNQTHVDWFTKRQA